MWDGEGNEGGVRQGRGEGVWRGRRVATGCGEGVAEVNSVGSEQGTRVWR